MKPRNAEERRVVELSATLKEIRPKDIEWIDKDYKRIYQRKGLCYYLIMERCKEWQVIRYYYKRPRTLFEFAQVWLNEECIIAMAKMRFMGVDRWKRDSEMTIKDWFRREAHYRYSYLGGMDRIGWSRAKVRSLLPALKQRGMKTTTHGVSPYKFALALLKNNRMETLLKVHQHLLFRYFAYHEEKLTETIWNSIRVALRHGYHWEDKKEVSDWIDMINDLDYLGLDTRNPHYICPEYLSEAHLHWTTKVNLKRFLEREKEKIEAYEPIFREQRKQFLDMILQCDNIVIQAIPTAMGIAEEGAHMCHCVGGYYDKPNSLILSAKIDGKRVETVEVNLTNYKVVQSRGVQNKETPYHKQIVELVQRNMKEIKKRNKLKKVV
ncbi:PcfJ-like protein [Prevotella sp. tc2-28]|uniref:PcfJ domain-containing protein n=1 Tax=Prevotella sp. tc2-28 TaxID=1761888 RepID=UPI000899FA76|nr:PcfJ domain-containing protein [Prevotella sp. tc2-28]SEA81078.1 PcfJ-like protein [Prevotella sp. tc2-28]